MKICKMCGNEITRTDRNFYCSGDCSAKANAILARTRSMIKRVAKKYNFEVKNKNKIINAKLLLFKTGNIKRCPCDADNPDRYCGSARCVADVVYKGHCHCSLFWAKKEPLLKNDDELK